ncbi:MAG: hypothetical protein ACRD1Z_21610, partial [Vicinamibacteria bacterium]
MRGALALAALGVMAGAYVAKKKYGIELSPEALRARFQEFGALAPVVFILALALRPILLLPSWVLLVVGGLLFGTLWGTVWGTLGGTLGGLLAYGLSRLIGRE